MNRLYSKELVQAWKRVLIDTYGFEEYLDFLIQPSFGKYYLSYLPLINYTDRNSNEISDLLELAKDTNYHIRVLNFSYKDFKDFDTVTLRLDIKDKNISEIKNGYKRLARRSIMINEKYNLTIKEDNIDLFYKIISSIYKNLGTPIFPKSLLLNFKKYLDNRVKFYIFFDGDDPIGGYMCFYDNRILTLQIGGILQGYKKQYSGHYLQHLIIQKNVENYKIDIVDFGRSPYNGGTYFFKTRFGAQPIKIDILTNKAKNIYKAYTTASYVWKRLPKSIANTIGPKLSKYLVDL